jgi:CHAT domain-containing protein
MTTTQTAELLNAYCRLVSDEGGQWPRWIGRLTMVFEVLQHPPVGDLSEQVQDLPFAAFLVALGHHLDGNDSASVEALREARAALLDETLLAQRAPTFTKASIASLRMATRASTLAVFLATSGAYDEAIELFARLEGTGRPRTLWETELLGQSLLSVGQHTGALNVALEGVTELLRRRARLDSGSLRLNFGGVVGFSLIRLAAAAALARADQVGDRLTLDVLDVGRDPLLAELVHTGFKAPEGIQLQMRVIRPCWSTEAEAFQWADLLARVLVQHGPGPNARAIEQRRDEAESTGRAARITLQRTAPSAYSFFFRPGTSLLLHPASLRADSSVVVDAQEQLGRGTAVLGFEILDDDVIGWFLTRDDFSVRRLPSPAPALADYVASVRGSCRAGRLANDQYLAPLSEALLNWVDGIIDSHERLLIVPSGPLRALPFGVLSWRGQPLVHTHTSSVLPTLGLLPDLVRDEQPDTRVATVAAVGGPSAMRWTSPTGEVTALNALQHAAREAREVAKLAGDRGTAYCGAAATREAVMTSLTTVDILHLATHAKFCDEAPLFSAFILADGGQLTVTDLIGIPSRCDLIVASACSTGEGGRTSGDDVLGISRGLLACGARAAIVSLWPVDDAHTADLMIEFYRGLIRGLDYAQALREAQHRFLDTGQRAPTRSRDVLAEVEPDAARGAERWWAPFILVGT